jgi:flavin reductase (DIM6/NTAB) family NADH-FMN oxidoreductase RutF
MTAAFKLPETDHAFALRQAMRHMAGGVSVITAGTGVERTGLTVTTATSLSMEPPTMLICVNRTASAWPVIRNHAHFAVNILSAHQEEVAARFAGRDGIKGAARYDGADWDRLGTGASGLRGALAVIDCAVEEIIERHSHGIIIGAVKSVKLGSGPNHDPLVYGHGRFAALKLA